MNLDLGGVPLQDFSLLLQKIRELGFDAIRYASYRTAAKLRYVQKDCNFDLIDIWNVIESFREHGLNGLEPNAVLTLSKVQSMLFSLYVNLTKRLPPGSELEIRHSVGLLLSWLCIAYDPECTGQLRVFAVKVGLVTLSNGKILDKLRYIFSQISDTLNGKMLMSRFVEYLEEVLALPRMVLESPTFSYRDDLPTSIFNDSGDITINKFLEKLLADPGPLCLIWMPLIDVVAGAENVNHPVPCSVCRSPTIQGLRYKCQKCSNFNLCQNCFWQGKTTGNHSNEHEVKEYSAPKPNSSGFRQSFRKSLRLSTKPKLPQFDEEPQRPLNLAYIVASNRSSSGGSCADSLSESDEEHRLIARYTARLASEAKYSQRLSSEQGMTLFDNTQTQREMIAQLEARNRDIVREIARLRYQQEVDSVSGDSIETVVMDELVTLRYHESDLEQKLNKLKESRDHLMGQIEGLMKLLRAQQLLPTTTDRETTPMTINYSTYGRIRSAPTTPQHQSYLNPFVQTENLRSAFSTEEELNSVSSEASSSFPFRNDLLLAADSVTHAMSTLVRELNADEHDDVDVDGMSELGQAEGIEWDKERAIKQLAEEEKYLEQLRNLRLSEGDSDLDLEEQVNDLLYSKIPTRDPNASGSDEGNKDEGLGHGTCFNDHGNSTARFIETFDDGEDDD